jgi:hypothetical protein
LLVVGIAWVIAPPLSIEKAGLIMTLSGLKNQSILLRIACSNHSSRNIEMHTHMLTVTIEEGHPVYTEGNER